ncbi:hypothetical protein RRG08_060198 [Elysia crispata]|uniref:Secreted protein n=1 Tax=Elysia crispata TaxID=231223 RepID=A0AAE1A128_9GAST|nr:hypothetical protein RRG08_060198 [Elysia crispata]
MFTVHSVLTACQLIAVCRARRLSDVWLAPGQFVVCRFHVKENLAGFGCVEHRVAAVSGHTVTQSEVRWRDLLQNLYDFTNTS